MNNAIGIAEVVKYVVQDYATREVLFTVDYATSVSLATNAERLTVSGGPGNRTLLCIDHTKTATFESNLPLVDTSMLGVKLGRKAVKGATTVPNNEWLAVKSGKVTLSETPKTGTLKVYELENGRDSKTELTVGDPATVATAYSITAKDITVSNSIADDTVLLCVYDYTSGATSSQVSVTASDFPPYVRITGRGVGQDEAGNKAPIAFDVKRMKVSPEFTISFANGEATEVPFNGDMFGAQEIINGKPVYKYFDITVLPDELITD